MSSSLSPSTACSVQFGFFQISYKHFCKPLCPWNSLLWTDRQSSAPLGAAFKAGQGCFTALSQRQSATLPATASTCIRQRMLKDLRTAHEFVTFNSDKLLPKQSAFTELQLWVYPGED